ncbi:MAG: LytR C-terminal domain-containing protein [Blastococcus sp.]
MLRDRDLRAGAGTCTDDDKKVPTPVGDQPTWDGAGDRDVPGRTRRGPGDLPRGGSGAAEPVTVEQLLARQGSAVGRRRAARRADEPAPAQYERPPSVRNGLPPVPGAEPSVSPRAGLPPVPATSASASASARVVPQAGLPRVPGAGRTAAPEQPDARPVRRSGPVPPLPQRMAAPGEEPKRRRPDRAPASRGRRRLVRAATALVLVLGVVVLYHLGLYFYVDQKIDRVQALATDGPEILAPQLQAGTQTYLVVGTGVPGQSGPASVATLVASVSAKGDRAVLLSVPPTALVDTPVCRTRAGALRSPVTEAFASSLLDGGPACMVRAVQQLSGLRIDHYLGVDLRRLPGMVDALGGVPICTVPSGATAAAAVPPPPGPSELSGRAATGFLRPGNSGADVTGAAVAERSQRLLTSTLRSAMSVSTLADPVRLARFLSRAADALTVDDETTLGDLRVLAGSLGDLSGNAVQRAGLPVAKVGYVPAGTDKAYVLLDGAATRSLFDSVIDGTQVPEDVLARQAVGGDEGGDGGDGGPPAPPAEPSAAKAAPAPQALTAAPPSIKVDVLNGTGTTGLAGTVAAALRGQGFGIGTVGNEPGTVNSSIVRHGPHTLEQARTVAAAVPGAVLQASDSIGDTVQLVIGPGYSKVVPVTLGPPAPAAKAPVTTQAAPTTAPAAPVTCG